MYKVRTALLSLLLVALTGCSVNFDIGPYDLAGAAGDLQGAPAVQCPPSLGGIAIEDMGASCRVGVEYQGVFIDGSGLAADVDAGIQTAATLVGLITRVKSGSLMLDTAQIFGGDGNPAAITWQDLEISITLDGGTEHLQMSPAVPNVTGVSYNPQMSSADLTVINAVLDAPTTSNLSGVVYLEGTLSLEDVQVLSDAGALSFEAGVGAAITVGI